MATLNNYIERYVEVELENYQHLHERIMTHFEHYGAYRFLENKTTDEIRQFTEVEIARIFNSLYSTQRPNVMESLMEILKADGGVKYFRGIFNQLKRKKHDIDAFHEEQKRQIQSFRRNTGNFKLAFGKNTISQIAHFCEPTIYAISNTKSQQVILNVLNTNVKDNYNEFERIANEICALLQLKCEEQFDMPLEAMFKSYRYIILDDFMEYVYTNLNREQITLN